MILRTRPAIDEDQEFAWQLNRRVYEQLVLKVFGNWDDEAQRDSFDEKWESRGYEIIEADGERAGVIWVIEHNDHLQVREIQVLPELQNRGIGTTILERRLADARSAGKDVRLRVLKENPARRLYERLGFHVHRESDHDFYMERDFSRSDP